MASTHMEIAMNALKDFLSKEAKSGILLILFAVLALIASNSDFASTYQHFLSLKLSVSLDEASLSKPILLWINDGLMAIFFLLVGLELKREICQGELSEFNNSILPIAGAIGGMVIPAAIYYFVAKSHPEILHAWAIPMATDIAFALGILALFGKRVPISLKLFLMTLAIIDDMGAILVIALFHTSHLSMNAFLLALACFIVLILFNRLKVSKLSSYIIIGSIMWLCVLKSGFHATIAGVLLALTIPLQSKNNEPMLENLEHDLHPIVAYFILPLFAFANAGVPLTGMSISGLEHPLIIAIVCGLMIGKVVGIYGFTVTTKMLLKVKSSFTNTQLLGVAALCGIGFTMSLFIASLSFGNNESLLNLSRLGILIGSLCSMVLGILILYLSLPKGQER